MPSAAFFDLDKTILSRSSALAFAGPLYRARLISRRDVVRSAIAQLSLVTGRIDHQAMERIRERLSVVVAGWGVATLGEVIDDHLDAVVASLVFPSAIDLIGAHRAAGQRIVIVTSTGAEMAVPIGELLGADDVLATRMAERNGRYTGEILDYMYGPRKAEAMAGYARDHGIDLTTSTAYSDSGTDLPMLEAVGHPHVVNPDRTLRRVARERDWPIHRFRRTGLSARLPGAGSTTARRVGIGAALLCFATAVVIISRGRGTHRGR